MSGFSPCVPFTPFGGVGGRGGPPGGFSENPGPGPAPGPGFHHGPGPAGGGDLCTAPQPGAFGGFKNTYDNNPIGCLQERMQNPSDEYDEYEDYEEGWEQHRHEHEEVVNEDWVDPDEWNDYDNLSESDDDEQDEEQDYSVTVESVKDKNENKEKGSSRNTDKTNMQQSKARQSFDEDSNPNKAEEVGFGVFKADEFGNLQQVGFGQQPVNHDFASKPNSAEETFPDRGWGHSFLTAPPVNGFGTFLDDSPFPHPGSFPSNHPHSSATVPFGRGGGICLGSRDLHSESCSLPSQEDLFEDIVSSTKWKKKSKVTLPNGLQAVGSGATKKLAKHDAARAMLDIMDGRAAAVTEKVSQSITDGLKALRGDKDSGPGRSHDDRDRDPDKHGVKTFKPKYVVKQSEQEFLENQKKHQDEILKQSLEYGPLGVKLWFTGDSKDKEITCSSAGQQPNRAPPDNSFQPVNNADERLECVAKGQFFIKGPVHNETMEDYIQKIVFETAWLEILKRTGKYDTDTVCKLCNLVFVGKKYYDEHKYTDDHLHVCKGYFPGKGGYHCFLCWISFNQPEGLLNHVARENHQKRAARKGVLKLWMEPESTNSWDLINVHKHLEDCRREDESKSWKTRDEARRAKEKERRRSRSRDRRRRRSPSPEKWSHDKYEESGSSGSKRKLASDYYKWKEVKEEKRRRTSHEEDRQSSSTRERHYREERAHREDSHYREDSRYSSSSHDPRYSNREDSRYSSREERSYSQTRIKEERDRGYRDGIPRDDKIDRYEDFYSNHTVKEERDRGYRDSSHGYRGESRQNSEQKEPSTFGGGEGDLREILKMRRNADREHEYEEGELGSTSRSRHESESKKKRSKEKGEGSKKKKKSKKDSTLSDHEEVNEIQDDFEIDSVGQIENGEETLQKMKCAIIGILDDEIFALNKKNKK